MSTGELVRLHHIGFVVASIQASASGFTTPLNGRWDGRIIHDPLQKANVAFFQTPGTGDTLIELVEPTGDGSPVGSFLEKGGGLHHLCYEVEDMDAALTKMRLEHAVVVRRPVAAVAFENRRIAWVVTKQKLLVELLEDQNTHA